MKSVLVVISLILLVGCERPACQDKIVKKVGGCNKDGRCGVVFEDGTNSSAFMPVEGAPSSHCVWN